MEKVQITINRAKDGTYSAYCNEHPALFGSGATPQKAKYELVETLRLVKEDGKEKAFIYPSWLDGEYELITNWDVQTMLEYYTGIITPTALGNISGIHPKQIWAYAHGISHPRKSQICKIQNAIHNLGRELLNSSFAII